MTKIEKIKAELERLKYAFNQEADIASVEDAIGEKIAQAKYELCCVLLDFANSLPEEPVSEDLITVAKVYADNITDKVGYRLQLRRAVCFGAKWQKEQMMANVIDGYVSFNNDNYEIGLPDHCIITNEVPKKEFDRRGLKLGDKVKVIIIKED